MSINAWKGLIGYMSLFSMNAQRIKGRARRDSSPGSRKLRAKRKIKNRMAPLSRRANRSC